MKTTRGKRPENTSQTSKQRNRRLGNKILKITHETGTEKNSVTANIKASGEKIKKMIGIFQLKKKLEWIKNYYEGNNKPSPTRPIGPEQMKLRILLKELDMLKRFNTLGFDSDAINLMMGLYYMIELLEKGSGAANGLVNSTIPDEEKNAALEAALSEWWKKLKLLPTYKERTAARYQHLGTRIVIEKLYSKRQFVDPLNQIINKINEYIRKKDMDGLIKAVKEAEIFCEDIKRMTRRPQKREFSGPSQIEEPKKAGEKIIRDGVSLKREPTIKELLDNKVKNINSIEKIRGEASTRSFFRLYFDTYSLVAMVYPQENHEEIAKITRLTELYLANGIPVAAIKEIIDNRIILQEDLGDNLVQKSLSKPGEAGKKMILRKTAAILKKLSAISSVHSDSILGHKRMKWEMDFFLQHFVGNFYAGYLGTEILRGDLYALVEQIENITCFAHRDFHSRNMLHHKEEIYLVDFQDSLVASPYYDLVSFAFDSYLDLKSLRDFLLKEFTQRVQPIDEKQLYLAAAQRNIKALGTFGYQVCVKGNLAYKKYIERTMRHIMHNPAAPAEIKNIFGK